MQECTKWCIFYVKSFSNFVFVSCRVTRPFPLYRMPHGSQQHTQPCTECWGVECQTEYAIILTLHNLSVFYIQFLHFTSSSSATAAWQSAGQSVGQTLSWRKLHIYKLFILYKYLCIFTYISFILHSAASFACGWGVCDVMIMKSIEHMFGRMLWP